MDLKLNGKRALVTGASRGLGFLTASLLSREGAAVAINSRDETRLQTAVLKISNETRGPVYGVAGDVAQSGEAERCSASSPKRLAGWICSSAMPMRPAARGVRVV